VVHAGRVDRPLDAALDRLALVLRAIGALWMVVLAAAYAVTEQLVRPGVAAAACALGTAWAAVLWVRRLPARGAGEGGRPGARRWAVVGVDLATAAAVLVAPAALGETAGFAGGYPFAALVVALAAVGRRGVWVGVAVLSAATLASLAVAGAAIGPFVTGQLLLYVFSAVAMVVGVDVFRAGEARARAAEAELAVATERAATASHLHDSVLQTLALVHRRAEDPGAVRALAQRQERELREWLFGDAGAGGRATTLRAALDAAADRVQEDLGVAVRVVAADRVAALPVPAGDAEGTAAVAAAAAEAMCNAAAHSGAGAVDVYAGAEPAADGHGEDLVVYVRDRGAGFDLAAVPPDRQGVRGSILARLARAGGRAEVDTAPGRGTEVRLRLPLGAVGQDASGAWA
jgi:signal transduction histidine kinase